MRYKESVLIVDDELSFLEAAELALLAGGFENVAMIQDSQTVMSYLRNNPVDIVTIDLTMPYLSGEELLVQITEEFSEISVVVISGIMDVQTIIRCMQRGAKDFLVKPIDEERLCTTVSNVAEEHRLREENQRLKEKCLNGIVENSSAFKSIVTNSQKMYNLFSYGETIAFSPLPVLVSGETGTGKELMVQALHNVRHSSAPFVTCNAAGIDDMAFSDTLFGHKRGAFTGADSARKGLIEKAQGGTLFLDEIGDLSPESQVKLLRLIQEGEYFPLGCDDPQKSTAWIVVATNRDLENDPHFRKDLFFRLSAHKLVLPPLRKRRDDLPVLIEHFLKKYRKTGATQTDVETLLQTLDGSSLLGNIRELEGVVADYAISGPKEDDVDVPEIASKRESNLTFSFEKFPTMEALKYQGIVKAIEECDGNKTMAAKLLKISKQTLFNLYNRHTESKK